MAPGCARIHPFIASERLGTQVWLRPAWEQRPPAAVGIPGSRGGRLVHVGLGAVGVSPGKDAHSSLSPASGSIFWGWLVNSPSGVRALGAAGFSHTPNSPRGSLGTARSQDTLAPLAVPFAVSGVGVGAGQAAAVRPSLPHGWAWVASARCSWAISGKPLDLCTGPSVPSDGQATSHVKGEAALSAAGGPEPRGRHCFPCSGKGGFPGGRLPSHTQRVSPCSGASYFQHILNHPKMQLGRKILDKERRVLGAAAGAKCAPNPTPPRGQVSSSARCCHSGLRITVVRGWGLSASDLAGPFPGSPIPLQP